MAILLSLSFSGDDRPTEGAHKLKRNAEGEREGQKEKFAQGGGGLPG